MTTDPAGMAASNLGDPQSLNRYAYVGGNPINFVDPLGLVKRTRVGIAIIGDCLYEQFYDPDTGTLVGSNVVFCGGGAGQGGGGGGGGTPANTAYKTLNCAALNAENAIVSQTKAQGIEFGGFIYKNATTSKYSYTTPFGGSPGALPTFYNHMTDVPTGASIAGWYHSHALVPGYPDPENFSEDLSLTLQGPQHSNESNDQLIRWMGQVRLGIEPELKDH